MTKKEKERAEKRIEVVKDVLKRLRYLNLSTSNYLWIENIDDIGGEKVKESDLANKYLSKLEKKCLVCAKGALFLSHIRKYNEIKMDKVFQFDFSPNDCLADLKEFDQDNLDLIEAAFQQLEYYEDGLEKRAVYFGKQFDYKDKKDRLKAILKNMLENDGVFVPPPIPVEDEELTNA